MPPVVYFINILRAHFSYESKLSSFSLITFGFAIFWCQNIGEKVVHKLLMKLTADVISQRVVFVELFEYSLLFILILKETTMFNLVAKKSPHLFQHQYSVALLSARTQRLDLSTN